MLKQLKTKEFYNYDEGHDHYDAHIKAYLARSMGINIVLCDSKGIPVSDAVAPMSAYLPNTLHNM
jgi:hypothetical protein